MDKLTKYKNPLPQNYVTTSSYRTKKSKTTFLYYPKFESKDVGFDYQREWSSNIHRIVEKKKIMKTSKRENKNVALN